MKNKKWLLLLIIAFPSLFWLILETSTINSRRLPFYGPKTLIQGKDTSFHKVPAHPWGIEKTDSIGSGRAASVVVCFLGEEFRKDAYRLTGLWEYLNYKKHKIAEVPFVLLTEDEARHGELEKLDLHENVRLINLPREEFRKLRASYFLGKPYYIDLSYFVLLDAGRHIRGYYDARYVSEMKRLIEEYQHLRLKEEKQQMIENNEIESKP